MKKLMILLLFLLLILSASGRDVEKIPKILVIQSYHSGYKWSDDIQAGIVDNLRDFNHKIHISTEYLDTKRYSSKKELEEEKRLFFRKYKGLEFDVVITVDNFAFNYMLENIEDIFPNTPMIFCGVNGFHYSMLGDNKLVAGVNEKVGILQNIKLIRKLHPNLKNLFIIDDETLTGIELNKEIERAVKWLPPTISIEQPRNITMNELKLRVASLPEDTAVLYTVFFKDSENHFFEFDSSIIEIVEASNSPIYGCWDFNLDYGIVGGFLTSGYYQGEKAANKAITILEGNEVEDAGIDMSSANRYMFDYRALTKWGIKVRDLPRKSVIINMPESFIRRNKSLLIQFGSLLLFLLIIIIMLVVNTFKRSKLHKRLADSHEKLASLAGSLEATVKIRTEELERERIFMSAVLDTEEAMVLVLSSRGRIRRINKFAKTKLGYQATDNVEGEFCSFLTDQALAQEFRNNYNNPEKFRNGITHECPIRSLHGEHFIIKANFTGMFNNAKLEYIVLTGLDVTKERKATQEIILKEKRFRRVFENNGSATISVSNDNFLTMVNFEFEVLSGYKRKEVIGKKKWYEFVHPSQIEKIQQYQKRRWEGDPHIPNKYEFKFIDKKGIVKDVLATVVMLPDSQETIVTLTDISDRKKAERAAKQAMRAEKAANRAKSSFLANMSHEIRTPLNAIIGMSYLMFDTKMSDEQKDFVETIKISSDALLAIINDILDYSKIEAGKLELENIPFEIVELVEEVLDIFSSAANKKGIELIYQICDDVPRTIVGDKNKLRQILINLVGNAIKFTDKGEILIELSSEKIDDVYRIEFKVADTGIGIEENKLNRLFKSFSQVDASTTRKFGGTGLGLAISKRLSEMMGGAMWVESKFGSGSIFHFDIQVIAGKTKEKIFNKKEQPNLESKHALIVDDNDKNRQILKHQLSWWGMSSVAVETPFEALEFLKEEEFDIVISDYLMPEMDGAELCRNIKTDLKLTNLPLLILTSAGNIEECKPFCDRVLTKPVKISNLYRVIHNLFSNSDEEVEYEHKEIGFDRNMAEKFPLKILVAEDNYINQKVIRKILERLGYEPEIVESGEGVLTSIDKREFDVILMDIQMPIMDGVKASARVRAMGNKIKQPYIIALTAHAIADQLEKIITDDMDSYLTKPVSVNSLRKGLEKAYLKINNK